MSINYILCLPLCREVSDSELMQSSSSDTQGGEAIPSLSLVKKKFLGKYAISAEEFSDEMVITEFYALRNVTFRINQETNCCCWIPSLLALHFRVLTFCCQVGAKSRNIAYLKGKVPSWVGIPTSVAIPFGTFEKILSDETNKVGGSCLKLNK